MSLFEIGSKGENVDIIYPYQHHLYIFLISNLLQIKMGRSRSQLDPRDMKAAYVVSDDNGYYDR